MEIIIITGLCGSGKTFFCKDKNSLSFDYCYSYKKKKIKTKKIDFFINNNDKNIIYLDAYDINLLNYLLQKLNIENISAKLIYTDIDDYYDILAIKEPRLFTDGFVSYDDFLLNIKNTIFDIQNNIKNLLNDKIINNIKYIFRKNSNYTEYNDDNHLISLLNENNNERLLKYIDQISECKNYQSIILNNEYIRRGTECDWITWDNILKCTSIKDKVICDTGCFNGYFSFKSLEEGAKKVIGIDQNGPAIKICEKIAIYNNYHQWFNGIKKDISCELGIHFYKYNIGVDNIFNENTNNHPIDIIFALNYLHHLKNQHGLEIFLDVVDSFFKNTNEIIFEVNPPEIEYLQEISFKNNFILSQNIESHRKTSFGDRRILHYRKN